MVCLILLLNDFCFAGEWSVVFNVDLPHHPRGDGYGEEPIPMDGSGFTRGYGFAFVGVGLGWVNPVGLYPLPGLCLSAKFILNSIIIRNIKYRLIIK
jgi:hypothetical protein